MLGDPVNGYDPGGTFVVAPTPDGPTYYWNSGPPQYGASICVWNPAACSPWGTGAESEAEDGSPGLGVGSKPFGWNGAAADLAKPKCYQSFGFNSAAAAQAAFGQVTFQQANLGQLQVQSGPTGTMAVGGGPAAQASGNTVSINTDFNFFDLSNVIAMDVTTKTSVSFDFLGAENQFLGTNMTNVTVGDADHVARVRAHAIGWQFAAGNG